MAKSIPDELKASIKPCPADLRAAENLLKRARKDLSSARFIQASDPEAAYTLLYDCMLHVGLAYMAVSGVRPDVRGKHKTVIRYMAHVLGREYQDQIRFYDRMRRKRHQLIYEPRPGEATEKEIEEAERVAKGFLNTVSRKVREENPQKEWEF